MRGRVHEGGAPAEPPGKQARAGARPCLERIASGLGPRSLMPGATAIFAISLLVLAAAAFWPQYLSRHWSAVDLYTHAHAALGVVWLLCLVIQALLILRGYRAAHRLVGRCSLFIAPAFVLSGVLLTHFRFSRMSADMFAQEAFSLYLPLVVVTLFLLAYGLGLRWRRVPAVHGRFMASTALLLLDPVLSRVMFFHLPRLPYLPLYQTITFTLIAAASLLMLQSLPAAISGRIWYRNYVVGSVSALVLFFAIAHTKAWFAFALWFRALPLT